MRRREFITLLGGAAAWPIAARAQQSDRMRRIAVLMNNAEDDPEGQARAAALRQGLACLPSGRNSTYRPVQISGTGSVSTRRARTDRSEA
jgi:hypothetical protein